MKYTIEGQEFDSVLTALNSCRVFEIAQLESGFRLTDNSDGCFSADLTREQLIALADEIRALAK